jgi:hypothetical protein
MYNGTQNIGLLYQHTSALALCVSSGILETCTRYIHIRPSSSNSSLYSVKKSNITIDTNTFMY